MMGAMLHRCNTALVSITFSEHTHATMLLGQFKGRGLQCQHCL